MSLGDPEDPPPLAAPVEVVSTREAATQSPPPGQVYDPEEGSSLGRTHNELVLLRRAVEANTIAVSALAGKVDGFGYELGDVKTFSSVLALDAAQKSAKPNGLTGRRVLVVEDNPDLLEVLDRLLCAIGCNVICATSRADAEKQLAANRKRPFHAALVDIRIPLADGEPARSAEGAELLRWLTAAYPGIARIGCSGDFKVPGLDALSFVRLLKPLTLDRLERALHAALGMPDASADTERPPAPDFEDVVGGGVRDFFPGGEIATAAAAAPPSSNPLPYEGDDPDTSAESPDAKAARH